MCANHVFSGAYIYVLPLDWIFHFMLLKLEPQVGPDMLISGFLQPIPDATPVIPSVDETYEIDPTVTPYESRIIFFYKTWDPYGAFSNFSPHAIKIPDASGDYATWLSVEHYYQVLPFSVWIWFPSHKTVVILTKQY